MAAIEKIYYGEKENRAGLEKLTRTIRVAAYCRVSTELEVQQTSLQTQMSVFQQKIGEHPGWRLAGIYADEGLTGTSMKKRKEFLRMLQDCEDGKIDYIITKSISRFARNTVECIACIRKLQSIGVQVYFEKEGLDTATAISEMLLTVLAAFAQEESRSISENLKWGIRKRYEAGEVRWSPIYGYRKAEDGTWMIEPTEAGIVRLAFDLYEKGASIPEVVKRFNELGISSPKGKQWTKRSISQLYENEKYIGDVQMQKYITTDHISHRVVRNDATEVPSYYVKNHHAPIVSRKTYKRVQRIRELRCCTKGKNTQYPYADTELCCPLCGKQLVQRRTRCHVARMAWSCFEEDGCREYALKAAVLHKAVQEACRNHGGMEVPETIEYWWLDEYVKSIRLGKEDCVTVYWKDGTSSGAVLQYGNYKNSPMEVAKRYRIYLERIESGEYVPQHGDMQEVED